MPLIGNKLEGSTTCLDALGALTVEDNEQWTPPPDDEEQDVDDPDLVGQQSDPYVFEIEITL